MRGSNYLIVLGGLIGGIVISTWLASRLADERGRELGASRPAAQAAVTAQPRSSGGKETGVTELFYEVFPFALALSCTFIVLDRPDRLKGLAPIGTASVLVAFGLAHLSGVNHWIPWGVTLLGVLLGMVGWVAPAGEAVAPSPSRPWSQDDVPLVVMAVVGAILILFAGCLFAGKLAKAHVCAPDVRHVPTVTDADRGVPRRP